MKLRRHTIDIPDADERQAEEDVRRLAAGLEQTKPSEPSDAYFQNLLVRTNQRIDYVTSGRAISLSWLARVAVPGIVAIIFFLIGLHYYAPSSGRSSLVEALQSLPPSEVDSLLAASLENGYTPELDVSLFEVSNDQLAEYLLESASPSAVLEALPEQRVNEIAAILEAQASNL
ncbi:MAG TPA: hypothetical protein VNL69_06275 [Bacteroidota bacterium]|nr:hypothetical protein [Bacteroidota bacterium]